MILQRVRTRVVTPDELAGAGEAARFFVNVNTPEDYSQARTILRNG